VKRRCTAALFVLSLVAACASAPLPRTYVLGSARGAEADIVPTRNADRIQLDPVVIPEYLDSTAIVMRRGAHELVSSSTGRWGERLAAGLRDALAADLRARLPQHVITTTEDLDPTARQLLLTVSALDVWPDGRCMLTASWAIREKGGASRILTQDTLVIPSSTGAGAGGDSLMVASMAAVVAMLADRIAVSLGTIEQPPSAGNRAAE
jgi:uncharacterized lipoprotein YmbA